MSTSIETFLKNHYCLIVEPSPAFSSAIQACLTSIGVDAGYVVIARKYEDAKRLIDEKKPKLLVTEYEIDQQFGLSLVEMQEKLFDESSRIAILVTKNSSDSVVAEAAEEQVDSFLLKPFSSDDFRQRIVSVLERKSNPSPYMKALGDGKRFLADKRYDEAVAEFSKAKTLNSKPALACYYAGLARKNKGDLNGALTEFREGRKHQNLHYKCLVSEFEILMDQKNYKEGYGLVQLITANYPLTPKRLGQIFMAAIFTYHFDDVGVYFDMFSKLDQRSPELVKIASMALFTAGRYFLEKKDIKRTMDLFEKGTIVSGREINYLEKVILELLKAGEEADARRFLTKAPSADVGSPAYNRLSFKIDLMSLNRSQIIEKGRKLVMAGDGDPEIFQTVVRMLAEDGKETMAETIIMRALEHSPELKPTLYKILETSAPSKRQ